MRTRLIAAVVGLAIGVTAGVTAEQWRMTALLNAERADTAVQLQRIAEANAQAITEQLQVRQDLEAQLRTIDANKHRELTDAQQNADRLAAELRNATRRLSIRASCPAGSGVPEAASASRVDDGAGRATIHGEDAATLVGITGEADACAVTLTALQEWARAVTEVDRE